MQDDLLAEINNRLQRLEQRVSDLEKSNSPSSHTLEQPKKAEVSEKQSSAEQPKYSIDPEQYQQWKASTGATKRKTNGPYAEVANKEISGAWLLGGVGVFFLVLAASFFIKLVIDTGWLTPLRQFLGVVLFGFLLAGVGLTIRPKDAFYSSILSGTAIVVWFMAAFAGHLYFELYDSFLATILAMLVTGVSFWLFLQNKHAFFLLAAVLGTYFVPLLVEGYGESLTLTSGYFLLWNVIFASFAILVLQRPILSLIAYLAILCFQAVVEIAKLPDSQIWFPITFQATQFVLIGLAVLLYSTRNKIMLSSAEAWGFFIPLLLFYGVEYQMLSSHYPALAPWVGLGFALVVLLIFSMARIFFGSEKLESTPMVATFVSLVAFHSLYLELLPSSFGPWLAAFLLIFLPLTVQKYNLKAERFWPAFFPAIAILILEYARILDLTGKNHSNPSYLLLNSIFFLLLFQIYHRGKSNIRASVLFLCLSIPQGALALARLADSSASEPTSNYLTSAFWAMLALAFLFWSKRQDDKEVGHCGVVIFCIVAVKVLLLDLARSDSVVRVMALLVVGALLYSGGYLLRRNKSTN